MSDTTAERTVAPKQLIALVRDATEKREKIATIAGDLGERVKAAVENGHLHRGAFALMVRLNKMEEQKRNDFIRSFGLYTEHCETALWGGKHTGDIVDLADEAARRGKAAEAATSAKNAEGIKELEPEKHADNQKPRRGRPPKAEKTAEEDPEAAAEERGRLDHLAGKGAVVPDDITADKQLHEAYLKGWSGSQVAQSRARDPASFDAAETAKPKGSSPLPGAEAAGSYQTH